MCANRVDELSKIPETLDHQPNHFGCDRRMPIAQRAMTKALSLLLEPLRPNARNQAA